MLSECIKRTVVLTGSIFLMFAAASLVIYIAALTNLPTVLATSLGELNVTGAHFLLLIMAFFLLFGMVLDTLLGLALVCPVLVPVAISQGADPVHTGIIVCLTLAIGLITPPLGGSVMVVSAVSRTSYWRLFTWVLPFLVVEVLVLLMVVLIPDISLFIPRQLGLI
jgi:TRAP-type C4-dicarboxylate transport system permease large subunit